LLMNKRIVH